VALSVESGITDPGSGLYLNSGPEAKDNDYWLRVGINTNHIK
jgi:hypothetical protein